jgi:hypothetical protein
MSEIQDDNPQAEPPVNPEPQGTSEEQPKAE